MISREEILKLTHQGLLEESAEELYDNAPCGYFSTLIDGTFVRINQTFLEWTGYKADDLLYSKRFQDLLDIGDGIFYDTHFTPLLQMQGFINEINLSLRRADGSRLPALLNATQVKDKQGKPVLYRTTVFDITDRKQYELELLRAKEAAEEAARAKTDFLSTVSHEIRTPMNAIVGIADLLGETRLSTQQAEYLRILNVSAQNLLALINDILDFSKIEAGKVKLEEDSFNIRDLISAVISGTKGNAEEKGLVFRVEVDEKIPEFLVGDPLKLRQVLTNLIGNAIKFTDYGYVAVNLKLLEQTAKLVTIEFEVVDTGIGIEADQMERVFGEFIQASPEISHRYGGTGLGLAISQRLLAMYSSKLHVESEPGKGSRFYFKLNLKPGKATARQPQKHGNEGAAKGLKVLLAEDNQINVYVVSQYLKKWGVAFDVAGNGLQAVEKAVAQDYDLILMDLQMPVLDGYKASRQIRNLAGEKYSRIPIIALTASAKSDYEGKLKAHGIDGIIEKPFDPEKLYTLLASYNITAASETQAAAAAEEKVTAERTFDLSTFDELMSDDPAGMAELLTITIDNLREANTELSAALKEHNLEQFTFWALKLETSLELLQAKQLQEALLQGKSILKGIQEEADQLEQVGQAILEQFDLIISGLESKRI